MSKRSLALLVLSALPLSACGTTNEPGGGKTSGGSGVSTAAPSGSGTGTSSAPAGALAWSPCKLGDEPGFECANLQVPLDYAKPNGTKITLALSRKKHTDADYRGVILSNPGGPGSPGRVLAAMSSQLPKGIGKKYDWIGIDSRGTGESQPKLDCIGDQKAVIGLPYLPQNDAQIETWKAESKRIAQSCAQGPGKELLSHLRTTDMVEDLESVRRALGVEKVTYWGSSYGSYLGMMYATLHPDRIEKMALDGVASPTTNWYASNLEQQRALSKSLEKYIEWLAAHNAQFKLGADAASVRKLIQDKMNELRKAAPLTDGKRHPAKTLTKALNSAAYGVTLWGPIGMALKMYLVDNNSSVLEATAEGVDSSTWSVYLAASCSEVDWPAWEKTLADAKASHQEAPHFSWSNTWFNAPCVDWAVPVVTQPKISAEKVNFPILLMSETFDGATPFSGALQARRTFPTSVLVEGLNGVTHSATLAAGGCTNEVLFDFFSAGKLPARIEGDASDKKCDPVKASAEVPGGLGGYRFSRFR